MTWNSVTMTWNSQSMTWSSVNYQSGGSESITATATASGLGAHLASPFESLPPRDASLGSAGHSSTAIDSLAPVSIAAIGSSAHFAVPADVASIAERLQGVGSHFGMSSDAVIVLATQSASAGRYGSAAEIIVASAASPSGAAAHFALPIDLSGLAERIAGLGAHFGSASDALAIIDSGSRFSAYSHAVSDIISTIGLPAGTSAHFSSSQEYRSLLESSLGHGAHAAIIADVLAVAGIAAASAAHFGNATDSIVIADVPAGTKVRAGLVMTWNSVTMTWNAVAMDWPITRSASVSEALLLIDTALGVHGAGAQHYSAATLDTTPGLDAAGGTSSHFASPSEFLSAIGQAAVHGAHFGSALDLLAIIEGVAGLGTHSISTMESVPATEKQSVAVALRTNEGYTAFGRPLNESALGTGSHFGISSDLIAAMDIAAGAQNSGAQHRTAGTIETILIRDLSSGNAAHGAVSADVVFAVDLPAGAGMHFGFAADIGSSADAAGFSLGRTVISLERILGSVSAVGIGAHVASASDIVAAAERQLTSAAHLSAVLERLPAIDIAAIFHGSGTIHNFGAVSELLNIAEATARHSAHISFASDALALFDITLPQAAIFRGGIDIGSMISSALGFGAHYASPAEAVMSLDSEGTYATHFGVTVDAGSLQATVAANAAHMANTSDRNALVEFGSLRSAFHAGSTEILAVYDITTGRVRILIHRRGLIISH